MLRDTTGDGEDGALPGRSRGEKYHFMRTDIVEPPAHIRVGMAVEFRPSVNPPGGKHGGKPIALEVTFVEHGTPLVPTPPATDRAPGGGRARRRWDTEAS